MTGIERTRVDRMVCDSHNQEFVKQSQSSNYIEKENQRRRTTEKV